MSSSPLIKAADRDNGQAGLYAPAGNFPIVGPALVTLTANRAYAARICPSRRMLVTSIAFAVGTQSGTDDPCDVGIYSADLGTKLISAGATSGKLNSTGAKSVAITTTELLPRTVYYVAFAANSTAALLGISFQAGSACELFGSSAPQLEALIKNTSYPLPSSLSSVSSPTSMPLLAAREG